MLNLDPFKKWFAFNRKERRGSFILLIIVLILLLLRLFIPEKNIDIEDLTSEISGLYGQDESANIIHTSLTFDPNTASFDTLLTIGLSEREAKTLISYRNKGGRFRRPSDIKKLYGMDSVKAETIMPLVKVKPVKNEGYTSSSMQRPLINLNSCDSAQLESLPGIGPVLSVRIIKYRKLLGGFASSDQLREVYGLPPETYDLIKGRVFADTSLIRKIKINKAEYKDLSSLPYLEKYEVTSILKYKQLAGSINSIADLIDNKILSREKAIKVKAYLDFNMK